MRRRITKLIYLLIILLSIGIGYFVLNDNTSKIVQDNSITYLLNVRTKKVHSKDCGVGKRSKETNKKYRTDSLTNVVCKSYTNIL